MKLPESELNYFFGLCEKENSGIVVLSMYFIGEIVLNAN